MKNLLYLFAVAFLFSCSEDKLLEGLKKGAETLSSKSGPKEKESQQDLLGHGYDVRGEFANANWARAKVIDVEKMEKLGGKYVQRTKISQQEGVFTIGEDFKSYTKSISSKTTATAKYQLFEGSITAAYKEDKSESTRYSYAGYDLVVQRQKSTLYIDNTDVISNYLTEQFKADCEKLDAKDLVQRYGTHVLKDISLGGKLSLIYRSIVNTSDKKRVVEAGLKSGLKDIFSLESNNSNTKEESKKNESAQIRYKTVGGEPNKSLVGEIDVKEKGAQKIDIKEWQSSVEDKNSQLIDIKKDGLIPLYKLIPNSEKQNEVKEYILAELFKIRKGIDFFLNGSVISVYDKKDTGSKKLYDFETYLQTNKGLELIWAEKDVELTYHEKYNDKKHYFKSTHFSNKRLAHGNIFYFDETTAYKSTDGVLEDGVKLFKAEKGEKYYLQLRKDENKLYPLASKETLEVYKLNMKNGEVLKDKNTPLGYTIY